MGIQFWIYILLTLASIGGLIFGVAFFPNLIKNQASDEATLKKSNNDLWGKFPGKSGIVLHKYHYFYNFTNPKIFAEGKSQPELQEIGPYDVLENQEFLNLTFNDTAGTVRYKLYKYFNLTVSERQKQRNEIVTTFNLPLLGVWYQVKNVPRAQVGLKALYTVVTSLQTDFFINVCQQILQNTAQTLDAFKSNFKQFTYLTDTLPLLFSDVKYGLNSSSGFFAKAMLLHPSADSDFFKNYFNLTFFDVTQLSQHFLKLLNDAVPVFLADRKIKGDFTPENIALHQWRDFSVAQKSLIYFNGTTPGFIEYGAYLDKFVNKTTNLSLSQVKTLLNFIDAVPEQESQIVKLNRIFNTNYTPLQDDSKSLLNKKHLDNILADRPINESTKYINDSLEIFNYDESTNIMGYLDYLSGEVAFQYSVGGTKPIGGLTDFVSAQFYDVINKIGNSLFTNYLSIRWYQTVFKNQNCSNLLFSLINVPIDIESVCKNIALDPTQSRIINKLWISGLIFGTDYLRTALNLNETAYLQLRSSDLAQSLLRVVQEFQTKYNIQGNYKSLNLIPLATQQWYNSSITSDEFFGEDKADSIASWDPRTFSGYNPELYYYCTQSKSLCPDDFPKFETVMSNMNFDGLFNGLSLQYKVFIPYFNNSKLNKTEFSTTTMINYFRHIFTEKLLGGLFITKTINELLWGYTDKFAETMRQSNYYLGGDPTIDSYFNLGQNMTNPPSDESLFYDIYTGSKDKAKLRQYINVFGDQRGYIAFRDKYFDGKNISTYYRNPWINWTTVNGTDALSFKPGITTQDNLTCFLDDLMRNLQFNYYGTKVSHGLTTYRYLLDNKTILKSSLNPNNSNFYADKFNGFANMTSITKAPFYAHKPYYYQCNDTPASYLPTIKTLNWTKDTNDDDDVKLFNESFFDVEPYSGGVVKAAQKLMISALIERDELFEVGPTFVPIYYVFRTGNFTDENIDEIFGDLIGGLGFKSIINVLFVSLITLFLCLSAFVYIKGTIKVTDSGESSSSNLI